MAQKLYPAWPQDWPAATFRNAAVCTKAWSQTDGWNVQQLKHLLPGQMWEQLQRCHLLDSSGSEDKLHYTTTTIGCFSLESARHHIRPAPIDEGDSLWKEIWNFKGPSRSSFTLWLTMHKALPTNVNLWRRRAAWSSDYSWWPGEAQSILHALRDCP